MSSSASITAPFEPTDAKRLLDEFAVSQAAELALSGNYASAESLLKDLVQRPDASADALDLLAKICIQQGRTLEAGELWHRALGKDPTNTKCQAAVARLNRLQSRPVWLHTVWLFLIAAGVLTCVVMLFFWDRHRQTNASARAREELAQLLTIEGQKIQQELKGSLAEAGASKQGAPPNPQLQKEAEATLAKVAGIDEKLERWAATQGSAAAQLTEIQAEAKRAVGLQESLALGQSNQVNAIRRSVEQEFASAKRDLNQQIDQLQNDNKRLAVQQEASIQGLSNKVTALHLTIDRQRALEDEIEQRRLAADKLQADFRALSTTHEKLLKQAGVMTSPPALLIQLPGVKAEVLGKFVFLVFEEGLFDHGTHFKLAGKDRLTIAIKELAQSKEPLAIEVIGYSDGDQGFFRPPNSYSLGLKRASTVVDFIRTLALFSPRQLRASSGGSAQLPFSSDTELSRSRNRTATLKISRGTQ